MLLRIFFALVLVLIICSGPILFTFLLLGPLSLGHVHNLAEPHPRSLSFIFFCKELCRKWIIDSKKSIIPQGVPSGCPCFQFVGPASGQTHLSKLHSECANPLQATSSHVPQLLCRWITVTKSSVSFCLTKVKAANYEEKSRVC